MLKKRGIPTKLLESYTKGTPKAVYGEVVVPGATQTIIFYAHYDGQPVSPEKWNPAIKPYQPILLDKSIIFTTLKFLLIDEKNLSIPII
jgi:acetylornithine deacetylase/succinyl-diaminopimelate desuccinylase-like protein